MAYNLDLLPDYDIDTLWYHLKFIIGLNYRIEKNEYYDDISVLVCSHLLKLETSEWIEVNIEYRKVCSLNMSAGSLYIQTSEFNVIDISDDQIEDLNYKVRDLESDNISFYCDEIRILSIKKLDNLYDFIK